MRKAFNPLLMKLLLSVFLIMVFTMWVFYPSTNNLFVWDTKRYLYVYEFWISKLHVYHIVWMFLSQEFHNWHPLTWLSWALDYQLYGGLSTWGFHLSSNILHSINSVLVFALAIVFFNLNKPGFSDHPAHTDSNVIIAALLTALLFASHPQHVESVVWVAERKDLLCQLFLILSMLAYVRYVTCNEEIKKRWFIATLGLFAMALASKPMAVTFPVVLLLMDVYPLHRFKFASSVNSSITQKSSYALIKEKIPFFLLSIAVILMTLFAQQGAMANVSFDLRILNAFNSIIFYLTQLIAPLDFAVQYPYFVDVGESITWKAFIPVIAVLAITLATLVAWIKGRHVWLIAWFFYLVTLSPVLGLIQVGAQGAADRYAYFPTLPVYLLIGAGLLSILNSAASVRKLIALFAVLSFVVLLTVKTREQITVWENDLTLWTHSIELYPNNDLGYLNIGGYYYNARDFEKAAYHFDKAGELRPNEAQTYAWRALTYTFLEQYQDAIAFHVKLGSALEARPDLKADQFCIQYNIGWLFAKMEMYLESSELFARVSPNSALEENARTWLNWLESSKKNENETISSEHLPGVCTKLLPIM
jgi:hypothetical protein